VEFTHCREVNTKLLRSALFLNPSDSRGLEPGRDGLSFLGLAVDNELGELLFRDLAQTQATVTAAILRWGRFYWAATIKYGSVVITDQSGGVR